MDTLPSKRGIFHGRNAAVRALATASTCSSSGHLGRITQENVQADENETQINVRGSRFTLVTSEQIKNLDLLSAEIPPGLPLTPCRASMETRCKHLQMQPSLVCESLTTRALLKAIDTHVPVDAGGKLVKLLTPPAPCKTFVLEFPAR
jgi:hypothetical protein